jgi:hypothetical protein
MPHLRRPTPPSSLSAHSSLTQTVAYIQVTGIAYEVEYNHPDDTTLHHTFFKLEGNPPIGAILQQIIDWSHSQAAQASHMEHWSSEPSPELRAAVRSIPNMVQSGVVHEMKSATCGPLCTLDVPWLIQCWPDQKQIIPVNLAWKIGQDEAFDHMVFFHFKACPIKKVYNIELPTWCWGPTQGRQVWVLWIESSGTRNNYFTNQSFAYISINTDPNKMIKYP